MTDYTYDFTAFSQAVAAGGSAGGMAFMPGGSAPAAAARAPAAGGADSAGGDAASLIAQSPFGALLNLPGVTAANLFSNVNPANYSGGNPFAALESTSGSGAAAPYGGNPFASIGTLVTNDYLAATQGSSTGGM